MKPRLVSYDWTIDGQDAVYTVDLALAERAPDPKLPALIYLTVFGEGDMAPISPKELKKADKLVTKLLRFADLTYAGQIDTEYARQYYFYARSAKELDTVEELTMKERKLVTSAGTAKEENWQSYLKLLYPDMAKTQTIENERVIALMAGKGDNLSAARKLNFYCFFHTETVMSLFTEEARLAGFAVGRPLYRPEQERSHGITLHRFSTLIKRELDGVTTELVRIMEKYDGRLSHFDCQTIPKKSPLG